MSAPWQAHTSGAGRSDRFGLNEIRLAALTDQPGFGYDIVIGENNDIGTATDPEDVWNGGGIYTGHPVTEVAETVDLVSDDANDTALGTGARTVELRGLGPLWTQQDEVLSTNGLTNVTSTKTWLRLPRAKVLTAGSGGVNAGELSCFHTTTTANIFFVMPAGSNQTQVVADTVPLGFDCLVLGFNMHVAVRGGGAGSADLGFHVREPGEVFQGRTHATVNAYSPWVAKWEGGMLVPEKSDMKVSVVEVSNNSTTVSAMFEYILVRNS